MNPFSILKARRSMAQLSGWAFVVALAWQTQAQPFIVSTVPANGASGVSPTAAVVFTFSEQMDTALTFAQFFDASSPFTPLPINSSWSANDTVLTCTPSPPFPSSKTIFWNVDGESLIGDPLEGDTSGFFTTSSGGTSTGSGTNRLTEFAISKLHFYQQTNANPPALDPDFPYLFSASTTLASNRTANSVTVAIPTGAVSNLTQNFLHPENYFLFTPFTSLTSLNSTYPVGNYVFTVAAATSNQQVTVNLPAAVGNPNAPHVANFAAAQSVNAAQAFQLSWDPFQGGTAADSISVSIGEAFQSPAPGAPGALNGTATSLTIPAGTLQPNSNYSASISFLRFSGTSNASYTTSASLSTATDFNLVTSSGSVTGPLVLTNAARSAGAFTFNVISSPGQTFTVEYSSTLLTNQWLPLLTTNSASGLVRITHAASNPYLFYRAKKSP
jgi:hypothetical protein